MGRFHRGKGQHYLLIALRRLVNEGVKVELNLVGVGSSGKQWLQSLTEKLGLQDRVAFHENLPSKDISLLFRRCHL
ncbi:glycosyltransferase, partial [Oleiphilus sp. HI0079]|uniref:glycosyltransferase n=1 Tax=Oleiphilus sp. HI0079 TaxID=1822254 RepID=UPI001E449521